MKTSVFPQAYRRQRRTPTAPPADPTNASARANATADSCKNGMQHRSDAAAAAADAQSMATQMQHHLAYVAVGRDARSMAPAPRVELNTVNIQKLHDLHPPVEPAELPLPLPEALQIDVETVAKVRRSASRGSPAGLFRRGEKYRESQLGIKFSPGGPPENCFRQLGSPDVISTFLEGLKIRFCTNKSCSMFLATHRSPGRTQD
jgi:hypothetical protein